MSVFVIKDVIAVLKLVQLFNPTCTGGGGASEVSLDKFCRTRKTAALSAAPLHDFSWKSCGYFDTNFSKTDLLLRSHVTFATKGQPKE